MQRYYASFKPRPPFRKMVLGVVLCLALLLFLLWMRSSTGVPTGLATTPLPTAPPSTPAPALTQAPFPGSGGDPLPSESLSSAEGAIEAGTEQQGATTQAMASATVPAQGQEPEGEASSASEQVGEGWIENGWNGILVLTFVYGLGFASAWFFMTRTPFGRSLSTGQPINLLKFLQSPQIPAEEDVEQTPSISSGNGSVKPAPQKPARHPAKPHRAPQVLPRSTSLTYRVSDFHLAKKGNTPEEYEDAFQIDELQHAILVADGAGDAFESRRWAALLVEEFAGKSIRTEDDIKASIPTLQEKWQMLIQGAQRISHVPWYTQSKSLRGSAAALLGLYLNPEDHSWAAFAVGDVCLFHIRNGQLIRPFPLQSSREFDNTPDLILTVLPPDQPLNMKRCEGSLETGDCLILATDALGGWFLQSYEQGHQPWQTLTSIRNPKKFEEFVHQLWAERQMRLDDITLVLITIGETVSP